MKFGMHHYRPLLAGLTIEKSVINGLGLHAQVDWKAGVLLGDTHVWNDRINDWIRTPLGGFINHSEEPNCVKWCEDDKYFVKTIKEIPNGQELFLKYTFYNIT